ncbi:MAG TPA: hypothetical protein VGL56_10525 [Fimbriimonadaceae bacterium]|jgi:hypothetical protein
MTDIESELAEYANSKAQEICEYIHSQTEQVYSGVYFLTEASRDNAVQPFLNLHRSETTAWSTGLLFTLFAVDDGDIEYEPRLQAVETCLRKLPELQRMERLTAPDSMIKDMLAADIYLTDRRKSARIEGGDTEDAG